MWQQWCSLRETILNHHHHHLQRVDVAAVDVLVEHKLLSVRGMPLPACTSFTLRVPHYILKDQHTSAGDRESACLVFVLFIYLGCVIRLALALAHAPQRGKTPHIQIWAYVYLAFARRLPVGVERLPQRRRALRRCESLRRPVPAHVVPDLHLVGGATTGYCNGSGSVVTYHAGAVALYKGS